MKLRTKFEDEDFKLGEVVEANVYYGGSERIKVIAEPTKGGMITFYFETLKELNEMFEDAPEEPKEYWYISCDGEIEHDKDQGTDFDKDCKDVGNYFETKEEAEKALERLRAWKRLKDKGFRFEGIKQDYTRFFSQQKPMRIGRKYLQFNKAEDEEWLKENWEDLGSLFGGEE